MSKINRKFLLALKEGDLITAEQMINENSHKVANSLAIENTFQDDMENSADTIEIFSIPLRRNDVPMLKLLLNHFDLVGFASQYILEQSVKNSTVEIIKIILDYNDIDVNESEAMQYAANRGDVAIMKLLIERGGNINKRSSEQKPLIEYAMHEYQFQMVQFLMDNGFNVNVPNSRLRPLAEDVKSFYELNKKYSIHGFPEKPMTQDYIQKLEAEINALKNRVSSLEQQLAKQHKNESQPQTNRRSIF